MVTPSIYKTETKEFRQLWIEFIHDLQNRICAALEEIDGNAKFIQEEWQRAEGRGGGGITRVIANGNVFEKGGVNTSVVYGKVTPKMRKSLQLDGAKWFACGLSLVLHPVNPHAPTVHMNYRYFEIVNPDGTQTAWFGGGTGI